MEILGADGPGHRLFPVGDDAALLEALRLAVEDPERERRGAVELQQDVLRRFSWDESAEKTVQVYEALLSGS